MRILDLGSGNGRIAGRLAERGAKVTAVDRVSSSSHLDGVTFITAEAVAYVDQLAADEKFDLIVLRNLIQFLDGQVVLKHVLPKLMSHVAPDGLIALGTFYRDPDPPFERPIRSVYTLPDIRSVFSTWPEIFADQRQETMNDLRGQERLFYVTELIVQRPRAL
jgi:2-polyprenyl-3-methyl-5-hydroxy-6-metoxy-1,4-benzoquinol methylase